MFVRLMSHGSGGRDANCCKSLLPRNGKEFPSSPSVKFSLFHSKPVHFINPQVSASEALRKPWGKALFLPSLGRSTSVGVRADGLASYQCQVNYLGANNFTLKWELKYVLLKLPEWGRKERGRR